tara:strand:- start:25838 stop:27172 length:1335 start_codon:yes stop_codon:yes gene_type:complete
MSWEKVSLGQFLKNRLGRYKPNDPIIQGLKRIDKIDFSGKIHVSEKPSNTDMILIKKGDLVISGINVEKGAMNIYQGEEDVVATIHYSSYQFDNDKIDIDFLKNFLKSSEFKDALKEQVPGGIKTEIKPKHILPLVVYIPTDIKEQKEVVRKLMSKNDAIGELSSELSHQLDLVKQLRQSFLREAMQGKLVKSTNTKETGQQLLEKIKAEKAKLIADKNPSSALRVKKVKPLAPITEEEIPFEIPEHWVWCRLGDVVSMSRGKFSIRPRNDPNYFGGDYPFIQIGSLDENGSIINEAPQSLNEKGYKVSKEFPINTIVIAIVGGTIANLGVLGRNMCFTDSIVGIYPLHFYNQEFVLNFLRYKQPEIKESSYQMSGQPNIKIPTLENLAYPLPPLHEQEQIVAKLEELMGICDGLEQSIKESQRYNEMLLQQVLREALQGEEVN